MTVGWHRNAIIYALDVKTFCDSDGDGIGDFRGLTGRLDYLAELGVTCIWLLPFYPSPNRDDGYDVADFFDVDPRLGTLDDFATFTHEAHQRDIRVIVDLVVNHTSRDHPWFQAAAQDRTSKYWGYYIWADEIREEERRGGPIFPGEQTSNWAFHEPAGAYYWHWFYDHQPDLNTGNPEVRATIKDIIGFWLAHGVSGFRIDAAPFLFKRKGLSGSHPEDPGAFLLELRDFLISTRSDAIFLAEADVTTDELSFFLGEGERMHLLLNFILNNHFFLALATERAEPIRRALESLPARPDRSQWANFARNHDELNLDRLHPAEREAVFERFAPDPAMRIYGRGIRRRLPPMLEGSQARIKMAYSLLMSLPGVPVIRYGEEIGMGDDLSIPGRLSVRTPMQWSDQTNGGFSTAPPGRLIRPVVTNGEFGFEKVNVEAQCRDPSSLLSFIRELIRTRLSCPEIGRGTFAGIDVADPRVFAHICEWEKGAILGVHNLSADECDVSLPIQVSEKGPFSEIFADRDYGAEVEISSSFQMGPYGYRWLRR